MSKGILLIAMGKHYAYLADNMAKSIKRFSDIPISCITDETESAILGEYDKIIRPELADTLEGYAFNPFKLKTYIYDYTPYDHTIYLDVDGIALKDLEPLFKFKFKIQEVSKYTYETADNCDMVWTNKAGKCLKDVFDAWKLPQDREYPEYNSSIIVFNKSKKNEKYFTRVKKNYLDRRIPHKAIGGLYPDELAWNLASAQLQHYTETPHNKPIFFDWENRKMPIDEMQRKYFILGMAGGYHTGKLKAFYENTCRQFSKNWRFDSMKKIFHKNK